MTVATAKTQTARMKLNKAFASPVSRLKAMGIPTGLVSNADDRIREAQWISAATIPADQYLL